MPLFTVVAGPNGAGKSTFSAMLSRKGALIFDPDAVKAKIEKQYPDISEDALESAVTRKYADIQVRAIAETKHLTVETKLRNNFLLESEETFRNCRYETRLIYMLLPDLATSMDRVNLRVKQKGHFVDAESIKTNFEKGLENFYKMAPHFDGVMLISGVSPNPALTTVPSLLLTIRNKNIIQVQERMPEWCRSVVERLLNDLDLGRQGSRHKR